MPLSLDHPQSSVENAARTRIERPCPGLPVPLRPHLLASLADLPKVRHATTRTACQSLGPGRQPITAGANELERSCLEDLLSVVETVRYVELSF